MNMSERLRMQDEAQHDMEYFMRRVRLAQWVCGCALVALVVRWVVG